MVTREERRLQNRKQDNVAFLNYIPSSLSMKEGETVEAIVNGRLREYKKREGLVFYKEYILDGNEKVERSLDVGNEYKQKSKVIIDMNGYQVGNFKTSQLLCFGYDATINAGVGGTTTVDAKTIDGVTNAQGYRMIGDGRVIGVSLQYDVVTSGIGTFKATVQKNGSNQSMNVSSDVTPVGDEGAQSTDNSFTFVEGDRINVELELEETSAANPIDVDDIAVLVEIQT